MSNHHNDAHDDPGFSRLAMRVSEHVETRLEYTRLVVYEKFAGAFVRHVSANILARLVMFFSFFVSIAAGIWIGDAYANYAVGFGIVALVYLGVLLLYLALRKPVFEKKMLDAVVKTLCEEQENEDDDDEA